MIDDILSTDHNSENLISSNINNDKIDEPAEKNTNINQLPDFQFSSNRTDNTKHMNQLLDDDILNEFLDPNVFDQNIEANIYANEIVADSASSATDSTSRISPSELKRYQESKDELMNVKFGLTNDSKYIHHSNIGYCYTRDPTINNPEDPEVTTTILPDVYQEAFLKPDESFPFNITLKDLPSHSRVETQIKLDLSISPAPDKFLLHLPRDLITKPKFTISDNKVSESLKKHLLYLDVFVIGSNNSNSNDTRIKSCNVCKRCMRRELKRASRRKAGLVDDSSNWDINLPKRAIIFNAKEIVSFPPPNPNLKNERNIELLSRIVCYCRHHQELDGFQLLFFLKDENDVILGKTLSSPILIMDRKKTVKSKDHQNIAELTNISSANSPALKTSQSATILSDNIMDNLTNISSQSLNNLNLLPTNNSNKPSNGLFSSIFSFNPSTIIGDTTSNSDSRNSKRQKRNWSQSEASTSTYYDTVNQQRLPGQSSISNSSKVSIKKDAASPLSSDAISPHAHHMLSSATSVFSATPERKSITRQSISMQHSSNNSDAQFHSDTTNDSAQQLVITNDNDMNMINDVLSIENDPIIKRIIPAQGPVVGGIEITLLGSNFKPGMNVKFGSNIALATQVWSESTIVTYLPPASQAGPVLVTFENSSYDIQKSSISNQIFTYIDDTDRQLIELALQIVGLKMNGKLEDAKNIAKRIVGNNQMEGGNTSNSGSTSAVNQQLQLNWMTIASNKIKDLSKSTHNHEEILIKFLMMMKIPNSPITTPNWAICNNEGQTMIHLACFRNYNRLCSYLIQNGSRFDYKDNNGFQPINYGFIKGHRKIINLINKFNNFKNINNRLDNGILLSAISDSNVLDLIDIGDKAMLDEDEYEGAFDDEYEFNNLEFDVDDISSDELEDTLSSSGDKNILTHRVRHRKNSNIHHNRHLDEEFEADNEDEDEDEYSNSDNEQRTGVPPSGNSFGDNLWIAMKEAIKNKMAEVQRNSLNTLHINSTTQTREDDESEVELPAYDELFPKGASFKSLINFRGHDEPGNDSNGKSKMVQPQHNLSIHAERETIYSDDYEEVELIAKNLRTSINSDKRLLFFWLPSLLLLSLIFIGINFNLISIQNFKNFSILLAKVREIVGSFMLGKERFTNLLNERLTYGREKMENLINDVNDAVMTAVGR